MNAEQVSRPRCAACLRLLTDQDIASGLCPQCGGSVLPKEPQE